MTEFEQTIASVEELDNRFERIIELAEANELSEEFSSLCWDAYTYAEDWRELIESAGYEYWDVYGAWQQLVQVHLLHTDDPSEVKWDEFIERAEEMQNILSECDEDEVELGVYAYCE